MFRSLLGSAVIVLAMAAIAALSTAVRAAESPSATLEKAIYTEETVGDLSAAVKLYEKAVADAKRVEAVAAKAQYRLGLCLLKQKKNKEAVAAFKTLVESYPNQKDWVAKAKKHIPGDAGLTLGTIPWKDGEFMQLAIQGGADVRYGAMVWAVESAKLDGKDVCRMTLHRYVGEINTGDGPKAFLLLDPEEYAINFVGVWKKTKADDEQADGKKAVRAFAEQAVATRVKEISNYKIRPDSWREFTVGGLPAVSVIGDYMLVQQKKSDYSVQVFGKTTRAQMRVSACDPDKLDKLRVEFDKIVQTLKIK
jgi:tetratricopeptide (TPR) repeat protein